MAYKTHLMRGKSGEDLASNNNLTAIVVDALRASSTLTAILSSFPKDVRVISNLKDCYTLQNEIEDTVLIGEQNNFPPEGFLFGNSPIDILANKNKIEGKSVVFITSNGAKRLISSLGKKNDVYMGCIATRNMVAKAVANLEGDIVITSAGAYGDESFISIEDDITSCIIAKTIMNETGEKYEISSKSDIDYIKTTELLTWTTAADIFTNSSHGQKLISQGFGKDISFCADFNEINVLPKVIEYVTLNEKVVGVLVA